MARLADVAAVFVDLDGTLYDDRRTRQAIVERVHGAFPEVLADVAPARFWERYRAADARVAPRLRELDPLPWRVALYRSLLEDLGRDSRAAEAMGRRHMDLRYAAMEPFPGALEALEALRRTRTVGLLTNGPPETQRPKIHALGLDRLLDAELILVSGEVGAWKPDAAIFHEAARRAGAEPDACCMVGNSLEHDVAAKGAGWRALWFDAAGTGVLDGAPWEPDAVARDWGEVRQVLGVG